MEYFENVERQLENIINKLNDISGFVKLKGGLEPSEVFLDNAEFIKLMRISKRTAQHWRDTNIIGYSMVGAKIYYCLEDIQELLKKNYKQAIK